MYENLELTEHQIQLAKKVYTAIRKAGKAGLNFWDDYGNLSCYNSKKITHPVPDEQHKINIREHKNVVYWENLNNFFAGNADDPLFADPKL